ncbi:hypothetical protein [Streptomyces sp. NBC_00503]|uniref:hypothetical protein n=1 Tax=Streptomyces sp. NBC_00503 TaxID=2903659 RepID=UPI002E81658E|nr:hypothetical protein [Streptomyces sp. NBC_00503]WUD80050.1 hypothetical protein OG490_05445 [Streptomyces sp. NBC_00503]
MRGRAGTVLAVLLFVAGCGSGASAPGPGATVRPTGGGVASVGDGCAQATDVTGAEVTVTEADNGRRICLDRHGSVRVSLRGTPAATVTVSGTALAEDEGSGPVFRGVSPGTAVLKSTVRSCPEQARPGAVNCLAMAAWQVTVVVR